jgi:hypothetical protein
MFSDSRISFFFFSETIEFHSRYIHQLQSPDVTAEKCEVYMIKTNSICHQSGSGNSWSMLYNTVTKCTHHRDSQSDRQMQLPVDANWNWGCATYGARCPRAWPRGRRGRKVARLRPLGQGARSRSNQCSVQPSDKLAPGGGRVGPARPGAERQQQRRVRLRPSSSGRRHARTLAALLPHDPSASGDLWGYRYRPAG